MNYKETFKDISELLKIYLPLASQWDKDVFIGNGLKHKWIDKLLSFSDDKLTKFDAHREHHHLQDTEWKELIVKIEDLTSFRKISVEDINLSPLGNKKKQHELKRLYTLLKEDKGKTVCDFGGGVGNLAHFLEDNLNMKATVFEKNIKLIEKGKEKLQRFNPNIKFVHADINQHSSSLTMNSKLAIGLHTCGNFANNMFKVCIHNKTSKIINFGCCYSKITNDEYNVSALSDSDISFNLRALSTATLSFEPVPLEMYRFRIQIMDYKYSFYHWLYKTHGILEFVSMSNARRSLYSKSFYEFTMEKLETHFPDLKSPTELEINDFYKSENNQNLLKYFKAYYAIARYIGKLIEAYIILDRALYLEDNGYNVELVKVFDPKLSPRNIAIIANYDS